MREARLGSDRDAGAGCGSDEVRGQFGERWRDQFLQVVCRWGLGQDSVESIWAWLQTPRQGNNESIHSPTTEATCFYMSKSERGSLPLGCGPRS